MSELKSNEQQGLPAFPIVLESAVIEAGLSKRELFAAMAMQGLCASTQVDGGKSGRLVGIDDLVADAVACADALLSALDVSR